MSIPASAASSNERSPQQVAHENALGEISDVLLNLEHTIARAKKAELVTRLTELNRQISEGERQYNTFAGA